MRNAPVASALHCARQMDSENGLRYYSTEIVVCQRKLDTNLMKVSSQRATVLRLPARLHQQFQMWVPTWLSF